MYEPYWSVQSLAGLWYTYILIGACTSPFQKVNRIGNQTNQFPCGKCPNCVARRVSGWSFRLMQERRISKSAYFITLTYDTKHVPITKNRFMTLVKSDLQKFFKRLRKAQWNSKSKLKAETIKYYAVGEYGTDSNRPHYHIILFNADVHYIRDAWTLNGDLIGNLHYGDRNGVCEASVGYTMKYVSKPKKIPMHINDDRLPEFAIMSKGLGESYLSQRNKNWHYEDMFERMYLNIAGGKKIPMPRYYKDKIYGPSKDLVTLDDGLQFKITNSLRYKIGKYQQAKMDYEYCKEIVELGYDGWKQKQMLSISSDMHKRKKQKIQLLKSKL